MTQRKALTIAVMVIGVSSLIFVLLLLSKPESALSYPGYAWKPGCHCGKPTATTAKPTTTTTKRVTTTTAKPAATATTKAASAATTTFAPKAASTTANTSSKKTSSTTTASTGAKNKKKSAKTKLALGALAGAALTDSGGGGSSGGAGGTDGSGAAGGGGAAGDTTDGSPVNATAMGPPHYYLSPVAIAFLLIYGVSFALYRTKRMRVATHRKVWNLMLLAAFLICGLLGLVLVVGITRPIPWEIPSWLLVWHVETGIAMSLISFFHLGWHVRYYLAIATGKRKSERAGREPATEKPRASRLREGVSRPPEERAPRGQPQQGRTTAERVLALERRQAARVRAGRTLPRSSAWTDPLAD
jgi:hypothetical protein